ncbi:MAG: outer membrane beta-barrel protein [Thiohalospira sp.]
MNESISNMDQVFRSRLKNYQQTPPLDVWNNIEQELDARKNTSGYLIYKIAASVAVLALIASVYFYLNNNQYDLTHSFADITLNNKYIQDSQNNLLAKISDTPEETFISRNIEKSDFIKKVGNEIEIVQREKQIAALTPFPVSVNEQKNNPEIAVKSKKRKKSLFADIFPEFYSQNQYAYNTPQSAKNWIIGGSFAPSYSYRHLKESNTIAGRNYYNNIESAVFSYSGGLNIQYKPQKKLTVQTGIYYSSMGQDMDHVSVYANSVYELIDPKYSDRYINSYGLVNSAGEITFNSPLVYFDETSTARVQNLDGTKSNYDITDPVFNKLNANIRQSFEYIEVPVIFRYKLVDKMIDVNLVGGVGANFLVGNNVYLIYGDTKDVIGKTNGVNEINYSGTLGFGLEYPILHKVNIHIEPSIKYYLNPINPNSEIESHPYSIGIFTGINYSF